MAPRPSTALSYRSSRSPFTATVTNSSSYRNNPAIGSAHKAAHTNQFEACRPHFELNTRYISFISPSLFLEILFLQTLAASKQLVLFFFFNL